MLDPTAQPRVVAPAATRGRVRRGRTWLRSPRVVVAEGLAIALAATVASVVPQRGDAAATARFALEHPALARAASALGIDSLYTSSWFLALVAAAGVSLALVLDDQWRRVLRSWRAPLDVEQFRGARYRLELTRPAAGAARAERATFRTSGRVGLLGSPVLHLGLFTLVVAGIVRMLFAREAVAHVYEGETLAPVPGAYGAQWGGPLSRPFQLAVPVVLERLSIERYATGEVERVHARLRLAGEDPREAELEVNAPLALGDEKLYVTDVHGPAVLVEATWGGRAGNVAAILRRGEGSGRYESVLDVDGDLEVRVRGALRRDGGLPEEVEVRVLRGGALLAIGTLGAGAGLRFEGGTLVVRGIRYWAELRGQRDPSVPVAYAGFVLVILGAAIVFAVVRVDTAVVVAPSSDGEERVLVALRAQRFAPLFAERFEKLVEGVRRG